MDHQVISKRHNENYSKVTNKFAIQFCSFLCELRQSKMKQGDVDNTTTMASRLIFQEQTCANTKER